MAVPNKKIPSVIIISQEFKPCKGCSSPTACKDCATKCWICSSSVTADERCKCVCQDNPPTTTKYGCNWQPAEKFPADPTMLAPPEQSCEGKCWDQYDEGELKWHGNGSTTVEYGTKLGRARRDRCLAICRQIARDGVYEM